EPRFLDTARSVLSLLRSGAAALDAIAGGLGRVAAEYPADEQLPALNQLRRELLGPVGLNPDAVERAVEAAVHGFRADQYYRSSWLARARQLVRQIDAE